jgi:hypothetical protein
LEVEEEEVRKEKEPPKQIDLEGEKTEEAESPVKKAARFLILS